MRVHHIAFRTTDLERARRFYADAIGLTELARHRHDDGRLRAIWMDLHGAVLMLETCDPNEPPTPAGSMDMVAFSIDDAERESVRARLAAAGIAVEAETAYTLYVRDPDGRRIGLSSYAFAPRG